MSAMASTVPTSRVSRYAVVPVDRRSPVAAVRRSYDPSPGAVRVASWHCPSLRHAHALRSPG
jgi:hypothetical protein